MKRFWLYRDEDETGVSGTGLVAEGVQFCNGKVTMTWRTEHTSVAVYDDLETVEAIHGHDGRTRVIWLDRGADGLDSLDRTRPVDCMGELIEAGDKVLPLALFPLEREPYHVIRTYQVDSVAHPERCGAFMVSAIGWPDCGYGQGDTDARNLRVVKKRES